MLDTIVQIAREATRSAIRGGRASVLLILVLALGIGASLAMFATSWRALVGRVPYPAPEQLVLLQEIASDGTRLPMAFGTFRELQARTRSFDSIAVARPWAASVRTESGPERLVGRRVSAAYFSVLATRPAIGPGFDPSDDVPNGRRAVLVSDRVWEHRFGRDAGIVGQPLQVDGVPYEVVGVLPPGFVDVLAPGSEIWTLLQYDAALPQDGREWGRHLQAVARLREGTTRAMAAREIADVAARPAPEFARPQHADLRFGAQVLDLRRELGREISVGLFAGLAAAIALLLVACANATNILLIRAQQRAGEIGLRAALGASRRRLVAQLVSENVCLTGAAAALGVLLAMLGLASIARFAPIGLGTGAGLSDTAATAVAAVMLVLAVGLFTGLIPALRATHPNRPGALEASSRRTLSTGDAGRRSLAAASIAIATFVLVGAGLLYRTIERLGGVDPGFVPQDLLSMQVHADSTDAAEPEAARAFAQRALAEIEALPGVASAALVQQLPLSGDDESYGVQFEPAASEPEPLTTSATIYVASAGYFETMGIDLLAGRGILRNDDADSLPIAIISESIARRWFADASPIGRTLRIGGDPEAPSYTVVGVARDVRHLSLDIPAADAVYVSQMHWTGPVAAHSVVVRTRDASARMAEATTAAIHAADANRPVTRVIEMAQLIESGMAQRRFVARVFALFGLIALVLATTGLYSVLTVGVAERQREIGLRIALGAPVRSLAGLVLARGMLAACIGLALGLIAANSTRPLIQSLLYDPSDDLGPVSAAVAIVLLGVMALACLAPLLRAVRTDPAAALRGD